LEKQLETKVGCDSLLDLANNINNLVHSIPKAYPPKTIEKDMRPISFICQIAKVLEGLTCKLSGKIDEKQYAQKGRSTTDALIDMLHLVYETFCGFFGRFRFD
jgi:hypothetical protein